MKENVENKIYCGHNYYLNTKISFTIQYKDKQFSNTCYPM